MTRAQQLAERTKREKERLERQRKQVAQLEAQGREEARKARNRRCFQVGMAADEAGLFAWENGTLTELFVQLARLQDAPDPVKVLEGLLSGTDAGFSERNP